MVSARGWGQLCPGHRGDALVDHHVVPMVLLGDIPGALKRTPLTAEHQRVMPETTSADEQRRRELLADDCRREWPKLLFMIILLHPEIGACKVRQ